MTTRRMAPSKVIECHADLGRRLRTSETFVRLVAYIVHEQISHTWRTPDANERQTVTAVQHLIDAVKTAEAYHVSADMTQLVLHAANMLDESDLFDSSLAPSVTGIVRFDGGIPMTDVRGNSLMVDWIVWRPAETRHVPPGASADGDGPGLMGTVFFEFNDCIDNPDQITTSMMREQRWKRINEVCGRWGFHGLNHGVQGESVGPQMIDVDVEYPDWAVMLRAEGETVVPATNTKRALLALWMLMKQEVVVTSQARPAHPTVTKAIKKEKTANTVTVVELRRRRHPSGAAPSGRAVDWSHRWWVNGFWRWQPYGPQRSQRRRIWIDGYVKGPDDKPLVVKPRVFDFKR